MEECPMYYSVAQENTIYFDVISNFNLILEIWLKTPTTTTTMGLGWELKITSESRIHLKIMLPSPVDQPVWGLQGVMDSRPPRKVTVFLFYHIVPGILITLLKLNLKTTFIKSFDVFLSAVRGVKGQPILWRGQIEIFLF